jgi:hypothetical protein
MSLDTDIPTFIIHIVMKRFCHDRSWNFRSRLMVETNTMVRQNLDLRIIAVSFRIIWVLSPFPVRLSNAR